MASWAAANPISNPINPDGFSNAFDLIQNCDLPPPVKSFFSVASKRCASLYSTRKGEETEHNDVQFCIYKDCSEIDTLEILKALRLSQTRAREAERKLRNLTKEKDTLSRLLIDESMRLFAHRRMVSLLEFDVYQQKEIGCRKYGLSNGIERREEDGKGCSAIAAFCLAIVGFGFVVGFSHHF